MEEERFSHLGLLMSFLCDKLVEEDAVKEKEYLCAYNRLRKADEEWILEFFENKLKQYVLMMGERAFYKDNFAKLIEEYLYIKKYDIGVVKIIIPKDDPSKLELIHDYFYERDDMYPIKQVEHINNKGDRIIQWDDLTWGGTIDCKKITYEIPYNICGMTFIRRIDESGGWFTI